MVSTGVTVDGRLLRITEKELDALKLWDASLGYLRLGLALGIAKETARDRVKRALRKLTRAAQAEGLAL